MREMEQQTDPYTDLYLRGNELSAKYKPSDYLDMLMSSLHHRWEGFVWQELGGRCDELLEIQREWRVYEATVSELLNWIIAEAQRFSREVTTKGDKGVEDHVESCKVCVCVCVCVYTFLVVHIYMCMDMYVYLSLLLYRSYQIHLRANV